MEQRLRCCTWCLCCGGVISGAALHWDPWHSPDPLLRGPGAALTVPLDVPHGSTAWLRSEMFAEQLLSRTGGTQWVWLPCLWWFPQGMDRDV